MFFDQLDERNAIVQSNLAFEELVQTVLDDFGWASTPESMFLRLGSK
jgi:hypothetical protein